MFGIFIILNTWSRYAIWTFLRINACSLNYSNICRGWSQKDTDQLFRRTGLESDQCLILSTHPWPFSKSKFNLKSDRVNLVAPASPIECLLHLPNVRAIQYKLGPEKLTRLGYSNVLRLPVRDSQHKIFYFWEFKICPWEFKPLNTSQLPPARIH